MKANNLHLTAFYLSMQRKNGSAITEGLHVSGTF